MTAALAQKQDGSDIDHIFRALSDPTRRRVVEQLGRGPCSVSQLSAPFSMAMPSFMEHLKILETCGLITSSKTGRVRNVQLQPARLRLVETWLQAQQNLWEQRFDQLDSYLLQLKTREETQS